MTEKFKQMLNKVPEVTLYFWIIKILCTTVGETFADFLGELTYHGQELGLNGTSLIMGTILIIVLIFQFKAKKYIPSVYWLAVVLLSVVGTLITDNLSDNLGVPLIKTTVLFAIALAITFLLWYNSEKTLSIHSIITTKRESFYWLAILFTFALGTAAGDLIAEQFSLGYLISLLLFAGCIAAITIAYNYFNLNAVAAFWSAYILTRPLGASIGDYLSQDKSAGGLGLGTTTTSLLFLLAILGLVVYLSTTKRDRIAIEGSK